MKKQKYVILSTLSILAITVTGVLVYFWISSWIEFSGVQDAVKNFLIYLDKGNTEKMKELVGGKLFVNIFGSGIENIEEIKKVLPPGSKYLFFKTYRPDELTSEEKRDYGFYAWKVNIVVVNERYQFVGGYSFFVSKIKTILDDNTTKVTYKIVDIKTVGNIIF